MNKLPDKKNHRILIVDDNRAIHDDFRKILAPGTAAAAMDATEAELFGKPTSEVRLTHYEIDSAYQGQEGVLLVKKALDEGRPYAMAFVDIRMPPGMDGVETTQKIWAIDPDLQIVICTAYADYSWEELFEKIGNRDGLLILKKPFDTVEALQLAQALTEKWSLHEQAMLKMGELESRVVERTSELQWKTAFLEALMESSIDGLLVIDNEGKKVMQNQRTVEMMKIPQEFAADINDERQLQFVVNSTRDPAQFVEKVRHLYSHPNERSRDEIEFKDGMVLDRYSAPVVDKDGKHYGRIWAFRDITERKRAGDVLRERVCLTALEADVGAALTRGGTLAEMLQRHCEAIVRHLDVAFARVWTLNDQEKMLELHASAGMYTHLDGPHGRVPVGKLKIGLIAEERKPHLTNQVLGDARVGDQEWAKHEGMVAFAGYPLLVEDRLIGVLAMFARHTLTEMTLAGLGSIANTIALGIERKRAETALRESEAMLRESQIIANLGTYALDVASGRWSSSEVLDRVFGIGAAYDRSVAGWANLIHPDDRAMMTDHFHKAVLEQHLPFNKEYRIIRHDDRAERWVHGLGRLEFDEQGRPVKMIGTIQDITERKLMEGRLYESQKMETVGKLAGGIAHEFNSILTAILGQSELLIGDLPAGSPMIEGAKEINKAAGRAATLTRQLLAYGRRQFLQPEALDLNRIITSMEGIFHNLMVGDVKIHIIPTAGLHAVRADAGQLEQVIMNLVINARDAMPKGGMLTLETANVSFDQDSMGRYPELKPGDYAMLAITDTGKGMSPEVKARAFEPFFTTKGVGQGTGLGLSTCYGIIKQSGGHISVYSEPGRGTTFKIYLPQVEQSSKAPSQSVDGSNLPHGTETILLVEDDPALREMAVTLLSRLGYKVLSASNGVEALNLKQRIETGHIDLLFTDVVMPHMSGKELADRVRVLYPHTKILFTSAYTENAIVHQGALGRGEAMLQKPFTPSALAHKLREALDQPDALKTAGGGIIP